MQKSNAAAQILSRGAVGFSHPAVWAVDVELAGKIGKFGKIEGIPVVIFLIIVVGAVKGFR